MNFRVYGIKVLNFFLNNSPLFSLHSYGNPICTRSFYPTELFKPHIMPCFCLDRLCRDPLRLLKVGLFVNSGASALVGNKC